MAVLRKRYPLRTITSHARREEGKFIIPITGKMCHTLRGLVKIDHYKEDTHGYGCYGKEFAKEHNLLYGLKVIDIDWDNEQNCCSHTNEKCEV